MPVKWKIHVGILDILSALLGKSVRMSRNYSIFLLRFGKIG
nr:MAG TPA: hypothetical protein [Caudoviricetes sp.]